MYLCDASSGSFTIDVESIPTVGKKWIFKKISSSNQVTIEPSTINSTIDGNSSYNLSSGYDAVEIEWTGTEFLIISTK